MGLKDFFGRAPKTLRVKPVHALDLPQDTQREIAAKQACTRFFEKALNRGVELRREGKPELSESVMSWGGAASRTLLAMHLSDPHYRIDNDTLEDIIAQRGSIDDQRFKAQVKAELVIIANELECEAQIARSQARRRASAALDF